MALLRWIHVRKLVSIEDLIAGRASAAGPAPASRPAPAAAAKAAPVVAKSAPAEPSGSYKDAFLAEIRKSKAVFYNMVVAQAQKIDVSSDRVVFTFSPSQRTLRDQVEQNKALLESIALQAGRKMTVTAVQEGSSGPQSSVVHQSSVTSLQSSPESRAASPESDRKAALKKQALADSGVQAMLEVFPAEIRDVEEM
jgi:hypothetical protein